MECCHSILLSILCDAPGKRNPFRGFSLSSKTIPDGYWHFYIPGIQAPRHLLAFLIDFEKKF